MKAYKPTHAPLLSRAVLDRNVRIDRKIERNTIIQQKKTNFAEIRIYFLITFITLTSSLRMNESIINTSVKNCRTIKFDFLEFF